MIQCSYFRFAFLLFCIFLCFVFSVLLSLIPVTSCPVLTVMSKIVNRGCLCLCRYVEQNNLRMEQRNDSLKNSSEQNQTRILQAEQDKVTLLKSPIHYTNQVLKFSGTVLDLLRAVFGCEKKKIVDITCESLSSPNNGMRRAQPSLSTKLTLLPIRMFCSYKHET